MDKSCKCTLDGVNKSDECQEMIEIFKHYDKNNNGFIEKGELKNIIQTVGGKVSDSELEMGIRIIDKNHDGRIDFNEFIKWWSNR